ncbi:MAG: PAS domain S-box protein [Rhodocyclaceae bacterium]
MRRRDRRGTSFTMSLQGLELPVLVIARSIVDCNPAACRLLGRSREAVLGRSPIEFSAPRQADGKAAEVAGKARIDAALSGQPQWFQWRFLAGGRELATLVHLEAREIDGRTRLIAHIQDMSRLLRAETSLRETELRLRQVLDQTNAVVFWKDLEGRYLFVNREFCRLVERAPEAVLGRSDVDVMPAMVAARLRANDARVLDARRTVTFEEQVVFQGEPRTYLVDKFPLLDGSGAPYAVCGIATDITPRKRLEEALQGASLAVSGAHGASIFQELARYLATILEADWVFVAVRDSELDHCMHVRAWWRNGEIAENFDYELPGTPCETVVGQGFRVYPRGLAELFPHDADFVRVGMESYAGYPLTDTRRQPLGLIAAVSTRPISDSAFVESVMKIFAVRASAEIERERMDQALRLSEASYRAIFEAAEDCIFIHDIDTGAFVDVNPKACQTYGYDHSTLMRLGPGDLGTGVPPYSAEDALQWLVRARAGEVVRFEWRRRNADGSLHWDEVCLKRVQLAGVDRILAVTRDITARKTSIEAIARSEGRLRATVEAALDCIISMDEDGLIRGFNPAAEACFGYRRDQVIGRSLAECLIPVRLRGAHQAGMARYLAGGQGPYIGRRVEVVAQRADGSEFPAELAIAVAEGSEGRIFVGYLRDITAAKRAAEESAMLEAQLRQAQKMEAIGHLAGGIAHDFNNILTSITGYLALADERQAQLGDAKLARYLDQASVAARRARDLIRQLLTFSRGQRGTPRPLSLSALVEELSHFLGPMLPSTVVFEVDPGGAPAHAMADPVQIEQVVMNLRINARDAVDGCGRVRIAVQPPVVGTAVCASCRATLATDGYVALAVSDDGPGIAPEVLERIFEPFFTTKAVGKGSGMGLATVHGIVHEHGGHVLIDTAPGAGTVFRVLLPALPMSPPAAGGVPPEGARVGGGRDARLSGRVLVVDDEEMVTAFLRELLEGWGLIVDIAHDGLAAKALVVEDPFGFDMVLSDLTMPRMTGVELASAVHGLNPAVPIVLFSGYADGLAPASLEAVGVRALLAKPVEPAALFGALAGVLTRPLA